MTKVQQVADLATGLGFGLAAVALVLAGGVATSVAAVVLYTLGAVVLAVLAVEFAMDALFGTNGLVFDIFNDAGRAGEMARAREERGRPVRSRVYHTHPSRRLRARGAEVRMRGRVAKRAAERAA